MVGHSEPAAGATLLLAAAMELRDRQHCPLIHLRTLNSYVAEGIRGGPAHSVLLPRTNVAACSPMPAIAASAFAFQVCVLRGC